MTTLSLKCELPEKIPCCCKWYFLVYHRMGTAGAGRIILMQRVGPVPPEPCSLCKTVSQKQYKVKADYSFLVDYKFSIKISLN